MGVCVVCSTAVDDEFPISRLAHCPKCMADLHACRQCLWYDVNVSKQCREPMVEWIADKEKSNFCDYYKLNTKTKVDADTKSDAAKEALKKLFNK